MDGDVIEERRICLNRSVLDFMESVLEPMSTVLEFGAGWSTRWFAERCDRIISIETSRKWADLVRADLAGVECDWDVRLAQHPQDVLGGIKADLALVDGIDVQREVCVRLAWPRLRAGGWLIFDDAQRERHAISVSWLNRHGEAHILRWAPGDVESARGRVAMAWQKPPCAS